MNPTTLYYTINLDENIMTAWNKKLSYYINYDFEIIDDNVISAHYRGKKDERYDTILVLNNDGTLTRAIGENSIIIQGASTDTFYKLRDNIYPLVYDGKVPAN